MSSVVSHHKPCLQISCLILILLAGAGRSLAQTAPNQPPTCTLSVSPNSGYVPFQVYANGNCTQGSNPIASTTLDFGDGTVLTNTTSSYHQYTQAGNYTVTVTATDSSGLSGSASQPVSAKTVPPSPQAGDLYAGFGSNIERFDQNGTPEQGFRAMGSPRGMAFDTSGDLYAAENFSSIIEKFDVNGNSLGTFGSGYTNPESLVFDALGNVYVGDLSGGKVEKLNSSGSVQTSYTVAVDTANDLWVDLAQDQCTLYYTSGGTTVQRFDVCKNVQLTQFSGRLLGTAAKGLKIRPNGEVFVADTTQLVRLASNGAIIQSYADPNNVCNVNSIAWTDLSLAPDGSSFWATDVCSSTAYHFDIASGNVLGTAQVFCDCTIGGGIVIRGEITAAANQPPSCTLQVNPTQGPAPLNVTATGNCTDPENDITSTSLNWGDGTVVNDTTSGSHTYVAAGTYTVTVTATDRVGLTGTASQVVTVTQQIDSTPKCTLTSSSNGGAAPFTANFSGSCTDAGNDISSANSTASLDFGDGTAPQQISTAAGGNFSNVSHVYQSPGSYTATYTVTDDSKHTGTATDVITVSANQPPTCTLQVNPSSGSTPLTVTATGNCTDPENDITSTSLYFGDGTPPQSSTSGTHTYTQPGVYMVTVGATDSSNQQGSASQKVIAQPSQTPPPQRGDVYASGGAGDVERYSPTGTLLQILDTGTNDQYIAGSAFDSAGNFYVTDFSGATVYRFDPNGKLLGTFGSGYNTSPESILFDAAGNAYVGQADGTHQILKFDSAGNAVAQYSPPVEGRGTDWIELGADQCTMYYTSEGKSIKRFDVCKNTALADFVTGLPGTFAYEFRIRPNGEFLVADNEQILRLDATGKIIQQYTAPNNQCWFALNLDPDNTSFWSADLCNNSIYHFDITTGNVITNFVSSGPNTSGLSIRGEIQVATNQPPTCSLSVNPTTGQAPFTVNATANCTDPENDIASASIDWGDQSTPQALTCNGSCTFTGPHTYTNPGTYTVMVTATDTGGLKGSANQTITVTQAVNSTPACTLNSDSQNGTAPFTVTFSGSCQDAGNDLGQGSTGTLNFGDNTAPQQVSPASFSNVQHVYQAAGTYTATFTATDSTQHTGSASRTITVTTAVNSTPMCTLNSDKQTGTAPLTVNFNGSCSDAGNDLIASSEKIDFGDGSAAQAGTTATHTYSQPGTYNATLSAGDSSGNTGSTSETITVTASLPPACTLSVNPASGQVPLSVTATGSCAPGSSPIATTTLDFGDGTVQSGTSGSHTYSKAGNYTVTVTATDQNGLKGSASQTVSATAAAVAPTCTLSVTPASGPTPLSVTATGSCAPGSSPIATTTLDFGDGTVQSGTSGSHTYSKAGNYTVTVTATDQNGLKGSASQTVSATAAAVAPTCTLSVTPASGPTPLSVTATGNCTAGSSPIATTTLDFGDGTILNASSGTHTYLQAGTFTAKITATDSSGLSGSASQVVTVGTSSFPQGVFVGISGGTIMQFAPDGTVLKTLSTGLGGTIADMAFDHAGTLYSVDFTAANVSRFDLSSGTLLGTFGSGYNCQPESMVFDGAGNAYVGQQGCSRNILKLDPSGKLLAQYTVATEEQGSDDVDLSADQCTLLYTSEGPSILRYDVCRNQQMSPFATSLKKALMLRILPDGGVIVADLFDIVRLDSSGKQVMTYTASGEQCLYGVTLDQDGTSFWASDYCSSNIYRFDIASGKQISKFNTGTPSGTVFGLAIAGSGLNVAGLGNGGTMTASPQSATLAAGQSATFTISFTPNATAAGKTLTLSCASLPPGLSCSFTPSTITLGAAGTTTTAMLTITRTTVAELQHPDAPWMFATWMGGLPAVVLIGLRWPRRRRGSFLWLGVIVASTGIWVSCGGGSMSRATTPQPTPQGAYTVIVVGTASGAQASTTVTLTLQ